MNILKRLILLADSRISRTKLAALTYGALNFAQAMGWLQLTPDQMQALNGFLLAVGLIFLRDGVQESGPRG